MAKTGYPSVIVGRDSTNHRIRLEGSPRYEYDYSFFAGGWTPNYGDGFVVVAAGGAGGRIEVTASAATLRAIQGMTFPVEYDDPPTGTLYTLDEFVFDYIRAAAGASISLSLWSYPKSTAGTITTVGTWTQAAHFTDVSGTWQRYTASAIGITLDPVNNHYIWVISANDGGSTFKLSAFLVRLNRGVVE